MVLRTRSRVIRRFLRNFFTANRGVKFPTRVVCRHPPSPSPLNSGTVPRLEGVISLRRCLLPSYLTPFFAQARNQGKFTGLS